MKDIFEYKSRMIKAIELDKCNIQKSNINISSNEALTIENKESYVEILNNIIKTEQKRKLLQRKCELLKEESFNKKSRFLTFVTLLGSITLLVLNPNILFSLMTLFALILSATSEVKHIYNVNEIRKIENMIMGRKTNFSINNCVVATKPKVEEIEIEDIIEIKEEILYLDDEI